MRKFTAFLLALVLLFPVIAMAEEVPTFDFTAEEWLERYAALVPEDDPYYFTEFDNPELVGMTSRYFLRRQEFTTSAEYIEVDSLKKDSGVCVIWISAPLITNRGAIEPDLLLESNENLRTIAERCILATDPILTSEDIQTICSDLGMFEYSEDVLYDPVSVQKNGITYTFGVGPYIAISMVDDPSIF